MGELAGKLPASRAPEAKLAVAEVSCMDMLGEAPCRAGLLVADPSAGEVSPGGGGPSNDSSKLAGGSAPPWSSSSLLSDGESCPGERK